MFIKLTNDNPETYTIGQLRRDNPQTSFPRDIPTEILSQFNVYKVKEVTPPKIDGKTQRHTHSFELVGDEWTQVWYCVQLPLRQAAENVRAYRDNLLQKSDWRVIKAYESNKNLPAEWELYRQALRDISQQDGFPYEITWPTKPE